VAQKTEKREKEIKGLFVVIPSLGFECRFSSDDGNLLYARISPDGIGGFPLMIPMYT
jgi:hypothetical protein